MDQYSGITRIFNYSKNRAILIYAIIIIIALILFSGCSNTLNLDIFSKNSAIQNHKKGGGYYLDDGPGENPPPNLASVPNAIPRAEPLRKSNMQPYIALGKTYRPMTALKPYKERGIASWYGRRYHGKRTASGEIYDMYKMTAAHTTLPIPSYVRVTNLKNNKSIIVRINDRGPFLSNRLIDLSYTAAYKLDVLNNGSALVEIETIIPKNLVTQPQKKLPTFKSAEINSSPNYTNVTPNSYKIYLQLAAFSTNNKANTFLNRIRSKFPYLSGLLGVTLKDGLFKVHAGPYSNQMLARQAANKISQSLPIKPILLTQSKNREL